MNEIYIKKLVEEEAKQLVGLGRDLKLKTLESLEALI